ncbi:MAG: amino acid permease [Candidatus Aenigmarchaeota archaeon]|nr:amino acid permease [Candidatus Aenigmarchaeota archaeon]
MAKLRRVLGLFELTLVGIGIILGAGIYVLIGKAAGIAGNAVWLSFFLAAVVAAFTGLSYAELSCMFPKAGAEYVYTRASFGKKIAWFTGWILIFAAIIAGSTVALGFAGYLNALVKTPIALTAVFVILAVSAINFWGIKQSVTLAIIFSIIESLGLLMIIIIGLPYFGSVDYFEVNSLPSVFSAAALIFFAFIGFEEMVRLSEETKGTKKIMPKALLLAIIISTVIYVLVSISAISVIGADKLAQSNSPLADVMGSALGKESSFVLSIVALFATFNTVLLVLLSASRIAYGMAAEGSLPRLLANVNYKTRTPGFSIAIVGLISVAFIFLGGIETVGYLTDFLIFIAFVIVNLTVIKLRYTKPKMKREFKVPISIGKFPVLPLLGVITSAILLMSITFEIALYGIALLLAGLVFYWVYFKKF